MASKSFSQLAGKRNSEDGATNVSKKHKAKKQLPPKEVESSISDEDSSGSMEKVIYSLLVKHESAFSI
jgi:hypothetical protein